MPTKEELAAIPQGTSFTDDEIITLLAAEYSDEDIKNIIKQSLIEETEALKQSGEYDTHALEENLATNLESVENIQLNSTMKENIIGANPALIEMFRTTHAEQTEEGIARLNEEMEKSLRHIILSKVGEFLNQDEVKASFSGMEAVSLVTDKIRNPNGLGAAFTEASGALGKTKAFGGWLIGTPLMLGSASYDIYDGTKDIENGDTVEGYTKIGGAYGGVIAAAVATNIALTAGATTLAAAGTVAVAPIIMIGAIGYLGYRAGSDIAATVAIAKEINQIYRELEDSAKTSVHQLYRTLGNAIPNVKSDPDAFNRLVAAGVETRIYRGGEVGIHPDDLIAAATDPEIGDEVIKILREEMQEDLAGYKDTMDKEAAWYLPENYESGEFQTARLAAISTEEALGELNNWRSRHAEQLEAQKAQYAEVMKPFTDLDPEIQSLITMSVEKQFDAYWEDPNQRKTMSRDEFMFAAQLQTAKTPETLAMYHQARDSINNAVIMQMSNWSAENPDANEETIAQKQAELKELFTLQSLNEPEEFEKNIAHLKKLAAKKEAPQLTKSRTQNETGAATPSSATQDGWTQLKNSLKELFNQVASALIGMLTSKFNIASTGDGQKVEPEAARVTFKMEPPPSSEIEKKPTIAAIAPPTLQFT